MIKSKYSRQLVNTLCMALFSTMAQANSIGINFTFSDMRLDATDEPGVVSGANWNNIVGNPGSQSGLLDNTSAATSASIVYSSTEAYDFFSGTNTGNVATNTLYTGGLYGDDTVSEVHINITNVPYVRYDVYVYASADSSNTSPLSISDGLTTFYYAGNGTGNNTATSLLQTTSTDALNPTVGPGQYQVFHETASSFTLTTGGSLHNLISNNVFGLQIVETQVPEPATFTLLGIGLLGLRKRGKAQS